MPSAELHVANVSGKSTVIKSWARNPICLLTARTRGESVWAYTSTFGGGVVAGDATSLDVTIDAATRCFLGTQASTKIYRNPARRPSSHQVRIAIGAGALLIYAPDAVQCFAHSIYEQSQFVEMAADSNLVLLDWMTGGRTARGERWHLSRYHSRNEIHRNGELLYLDRLLFEDDETLHHRLRTGPFNCFATVVLLGPMLIRHAQDSIAAIEAEPIDHSKAILFSASPLKEGAVLRFAGMSIEQVGRAIYQHIGFVSKFLMDDPWSRKF